MNAPSLLRALLFAVTLAVISGCDQRAKVVADAGADPDTLALEELRKAGVDVQAPQAVVHHLLFPTAEAVEPVAKELVGRGFEVNGVHEPRLREGKPFLLIARKPLVPTRENLRALRAELTALAAPHGGEYDGWQVHLR